MKRQQLANSEHASSYETLQAQVTRAEKIAAHIERQFKDSMPDVKIDYHRFGQIDPSVQLVFALMVQEKDVSVKN